MPEPEPAAEAWHDADVATSDAPATSDLNATALRDQTIREEIEGEMRRHVKFLVVKDLLDSNAVATVLSPSSGR